MTWHRALASIGMPMAANMLAIGTRINSMGLVRKSGMMEANTRAFIKMPQRKVKESIAGQTETGISENGEIIC